MSYEFDKQYLIIRGKEATWYRPTNLSTLLSLKHKNPNAKIIVGNTEVGKNNLNNNSNKSQSEIIIIRNI